MPTLLEVGCGNAPINWVNEPIDYIGVDPRLASDQMFETAAERLAANPKVSSFLLIAESLERADITQRFDTVFAANVLGNKHDRGEKLGIIRNAASKVALGGELVVIDYVTPPSALEAQTYASSVQGKLLDKRSQQFRDTWNTYMPGIMQPRSTSIIIADR